MSFTDFAFDPGIGAGIGTDVGLGTGEFGAGVGIDTGAGASVTPTDGGLGQGIGSAGQFADNLPITPTAGTSAFDATGATNFTGTDTGVAATGIAGAGGGVGLGESLGFGGAGSGTGTGNVMDFMATAPTAAAAFGGGESAAAGPSLGGLAPGAGAGAVSGALAPGLSLTDAQFSQDLSLGISPDQTSNQGAGQQFAAARTDQLYQPANDATGVGIRGVQGVGSPPDAAIMGGTFGADPVDNTTPAGVDPAKGGPYINPDLLPIPAGQPGSNLPGGGVYAQADTGTATDASGGSSMPVEDRGLLRQGDIGLSGGAKVLGPFNEGFYGSPSAAGSGAASAALQDAGLNSPNMPGAGSDAGFLAPYQAAAPPAVAANQISEGDYTPPGTDTGGDASFASRFGAAPDANMGPSNVAGASQETFNAQAFPGSGPLSQGTTSPFGPAGSFPAAMPPAPSPVAPSTVGSTSFGEGQFGNQAAMTADEIAQSMANSTGQPLNTQVAGGVPPTSGGFPGAGPATTLPQINVTAANPPPATAPLSGAVGGSAPPLSGGINIPSLVQPPQISQPAGPGMMPGAAPSIAAGGDNVGLPGQFGGTLLDQLSRERWMGV